MSSPLPKKTVQPNPDAQASQSAANAASGVGTAQSALLTLLLGAACIAFAPIFVRLSPVGPVATAFYRLALAIPILLAWCLRSLSAPGPALRSADSPSPGSCSPRFTTLPLTIQALRPHWPLALAGLFFAADLAVWHESIQLTTVANATLLANFAPIFVVLSGWLIWRERVSLLFLGAIALVMSGMLLLVSASLSLDWQNFVGDTLGILTAVFYAGYIRTVAVLRARYSTATVALWSSLVGAIVLGFATIALGETFVPEPLADGWVLLALALISQVLGQSLIAYALAHLSTAFSSVGLLFQPVLATILGWSIFKESLSVSQGWGMLLVLVGIYLARITSQRPLK